MCWGEKDWVVIQSLPCQHKPGDVHRKFPAIRLLEFNAHTSLDGGDGGVVVPAAGGFVCLPDCLFCCCCCCLAYMFFSSPVVILVHHTFQ